MKQRNGLYLDEDVDPAYVREGFREYWDYKGEEWFSWQGDLPEYKRPVSPFNYAFVLPEEFLL